MKKNKYDSAIVLLYLLGKEDLLPRSFRRQIPYSTISTWRKEDYSTYLGHEFRFLFEEHWDLLCYRDENKRFKNLLLAALRAWLHLRNTFSPIVQMAKKDSALRKQLLAAIDRFRHFEDLPGFGNLVNVVELPERSSGQEAVLRLFEEFWFANQIHP